MPNKRVGQTLSDRWYLKRVEHNFLDREIKY